MNFVVKGDPLMYYYYPHKSKYGFIFVRLHKYFEFACKKRYQEFEMLFFLNKYKQIL